MLWCVSGDIHSRTTEEKGKVVVVRPKPARKKLVKKDQSDRKTRRYREGLLVDFFIWKFVDLASV